jgi:hypothetical protein
LILGVVPLRARRVNPPAKTPALLPEVARLAVFEMKNPGSVEFTFDLRDISINKMAPLSKSTVFSALPTELRVKIISARLHLKPAIVKQITITVDRLQAQSNRDARMALQETPSVAVRVLLLESSQVR